MRSILLPILGVTLLLSGCVIHPLTQDYAGLSTQSIVQKVRCEIRYVLIDRVAKLLQNEEPKYDYDRDTKLIGIALEAYPDLANVLTVDGLPDPKNIEEFQRLLDKGVPEGAFGKPLDKRAVDRLNVFLGGAIAYRFTFNITENNSATGAAGLTVPITPGTFSLALGAGSTVTRLSERTVEFEDSFNAFQKLQDCTDQERSTKERFNYPITGNIGMEEVVGTFVGVFDDIKEKTGSSLKTFTDQLTFTTTLNATATPSVTLSPGGLRELRLTSASLALAGTRSDEHSVLLTLTPADNSPPPRTKKIRLASGVVLNVDVVEEVTVSSRTPKPANQSSSNRQFSSPDRDARTRARARQLQSNELGLRREIIVRDIVGE